VEHAFGRSEPFSLGVEEELLLVDERTLELVAAAPEVIAAADGAVKAELFRSLHRSRLEAQQLFAAR